MTGPKCTYKKREEGEGEEKETTEPATHRFLITSVLSDSGRTTPCSFYIGGAKKKRGHHQHTEHPNTSMEIRDSHKTARTRYLQRVCHQFSSSLPRTEKREEGVYSNS